MLVVTILDPCLYTSICLQQGLAPCDIFDLGALGRVVWDIAWDIGADLAAAVALVSAAATLEAESEENSRAKIRNNQRIEELQNETPFCPKCR